MAKQEAIKPATLVINSGHQMCPNLKTVLPISLADRWLNSFVNAQFCFCDFCEHFVCADWLTCETDTSVFPINYLVIIAITLCDYIIIIIIIVISIAIITIIITTVMILSSPAMILSSPVNHKKK